MFGGWARSRTRRMEHRAWSGSPCPRPLTLASVAVSTARRYLQAVGFFCAWATSQGYAAWSASELDDLICDYAHFVFDSRGGGGRQSVVNCIYGADGLVYCVKNRWRSDTSGCGLGVSGQNLGRSPVWSALWPPIYVLTIWM